MLTSPAATAGISAPKKEKQTPANVKVDKRLRAEREKIIQKCKKEVKEMLPISKKYEWLTKTWQDKVYVYDGIDKDGSNFDAEVKAKRADFLKSYKQRLIGERAKWKESTDREGKKKFGEIEKLLEDVRNKEKEGLPK